MLHDATYLNLIMVNAAIVFGSWTGAGAYNKLVKKPVESLSWEWVWRISFGFWCAVSLFKLGW